MYAASYRIRLLPVIVAAVIANGARAQPERPVLASIDAEAGRPFISNFTPADYAAEAQNWAVVEDTRGVLYVANSGGVLEYDGATWRLIQLPQRSVVRSLARDAAGRIWVGAWGDFGYLAPDSLGRMAFTSLRRQLPKGQRVGDVIQTHATDAGVYFVTSHGSLFRWDGSSLQVWLTEGGYRPAWVVDGTLYVSQLGRGLMRMEHSAGGGPREDSLRLVPGGERLAQTVVYVMLPFGDGRILLGTPQGELFLYDGEHVERFDTSADALLSEVGISHPGIGAALGGGRFALGTNGAGVIVMDSAGQLLQHINRESGLQDDTVFNSYVDGAGNLWLGLGNGLSRLEINSPFTRYDAQFASVGHPLARHSGRLFAGTFTNGLAVLDPKASALRTVDGSLGQVFGVLSVGESLLAAGSGRVYQIDRGQPELVGTGARVMHVWSREPSVVFVGGRGLQVIRRSGSGWVNLGRVPDTDVDVWFLEEAADGTLWAGSLTSEIVRVSLPDLSDAGVLDLESAEVTAYGTEDGLPDGWLVPHRVGDALYVSGFGEQVFRYDARNEGFVADSTFEEIGSGHPLALLRLTEDDQRRVWITSIYGTPVVAHPDQSGGYTFEPLRELRERRIVGVYPEPDGIVWFFSEGELIRRDTRLYSEPAESRPPLVRRVLVGEDDLHYGGAGASEGAEVAHGTEAVRFAYAAPGATGSPRFRTQLEGFDSVWSSWTTATERAYTNLPPGHYQFRVEAEERGATAFALTVLPPLWRTWWAYVLYGLLLVGVLFLADRVQRGRLVRRERERANREAEKLRTEAAEAWANYLQSENQRQTQELEQARELQLSMLPEKVPDHPHVEIAAYMETTTEVGGDYYDFIEDVDGTLTLVIGDATGHGLPAGTMVTATKGIMSVLSHEAELDRVILTASAAVRRMNLPKLYMALALARLRDRTLELVGAGMPPALVYRAAKGTVEEIPLKGVPLGGPKGYQYQPHRVGLSAGDMVLFMSDGFPELSGPSDERLGYDRMPVLFSEVAERSPEDVIAHLRDVAHGWCDGHEPSDDVTLIVMKVKS